ncbi:MAG: hydrophobe/amphiphile efflux family transporter [Phycisphaerales bacterium]|nr:hydrophobe/amphiphile efflux family transporter [Phycisphaerales bacterium]
MKFAHFFIDRPVFAAVISIVMVIVGAIAAFSIPISQYPEIAPPTVVVSATYPGANARTVADTVATPIEQQMNGVENMLYMSSQCTNDGSMRLTVTFKLGTNLDIAQVQVQNRVAVAEPQLPEEVRRTGITVKKTSTEITLVVQLFSPDNTFDPLYVSNYATLQLRDEIARLPGVGDVFLFGARDYSMRIWLDPNKLAARDMTAGDAVKAIQEQNLQVAAGVVGGQPLPPGTTQFQLTVNAQGRLTTPDQFADIIVKTGEGGSVTRIRDVGSVQLGAADYNVTAFLNGTAAVAVPVFQLPGTNSIATRDAVVAKMKELRIAPTWPKGLEYAIPYDTTIFVRESLWDVIKTLVEAILLVVLVVLVFLQSWRATLIPLLAVPVSLIGTCAVMKAFGFSFNNLSLFGLVLAIGIVVDDAIVVVENVERWIEHGLSPREATYKAMEEVTPAVIAIAFGLTAVFVPVAFISGITGQFYRQFALTISIATILSAINSLTLSPAMSALLLKSREGKQDWFARLLNLVFGWFFRIFNRVLGALTAGYVAVEHRVIRFAVIALVAYLGLIYLTYVGFSRTPTGFIPQQDSGYLIAVLQMPDAAAFDRTEDVMRRMAKFANSTPGVRDTFAIAGYSGFTGVNASNAGTMFVVMDDFAKRNGHPEMSAGAITGKLMGEYSKIQEGFALVFPPPPVRGVGTAGGFKMQVEDRTGRATPQELQATCEQLIGVAMKDTRFAQVFSTFRANVPQLYVNLDRAKAKSQDVQVTDIFQALQVYLGGLYVNDFNYLGRTYRVMAQAHAEARAKAADIAQLKTRNGSGQMVPLGALMQIQDTVGPDRINRYNLYQSAEINGSTVPGISSGQALEIMDTIARDNLPQGYSYEWTDLAYQERGARDDFWSNPLVIFPLCIFFVWLVHSAEYESFALSTAIILIVPMCLLCGIAGVMLRGLDNNIFTQIGFVVLAGLSAKNAVLIVEFAKQQQEHGKDRVEAAIEAARLRLRPILMTSFAFILGVLPLVIAQGAGAEMRQALGTTVFFGMLGVTFFGLFLTPVFFVSIRWLTETFIGPTHRPKQRVAPDTPH